MIFQCLSDITYSIIHGSYHAKVGAPCFIIDIGIQFNVFIQNLKWFMDRLEWDIKKQWSLWIMFTDDLLCSLLYENCRIGSIYIPRNIKIIPEVITSSIVIF